MRPLTLSVFLCTMQVFWVLNLFAQPYDIGYQEKGVASYYANKFHGRKTANGEKYNKNELTAAHKRIPFNSVVKVTNLDNGKSVIVRVNDRGPYAKGRVLDLSLKGAQELEMTQKGTARIQLEIVQLNGVASGTSTSKEESKKRRFRLKKRPMKPIEVPVNKPVTPAKPAPVSKIQVGKFYTLNGEETRLNGYGIQLASYSSYDAAKAKGKEAESQGLKALYIVPIAKNGEVVYRLMFDHQAQEKQLKPSLAQAKKSGFPQAFIKSYF
jgi:rare lipoprotein A